MKTMSLFLLFALVFFSGWWSRGFFPVEFAVSPTEHGDFERTESGEHRRAQPLAEGLLAGGDLLLRDDLVAVSDQRLVALFLTQLSEHRIAEAAELISARSVDLSADDIHLLGAIVTSYVTKNGVDSYMGFPLLQALEARIASLDIHAPSAQFFGVVRQADLEPLLALANFDALSSYYQEQVSTDQLEYLGGWLLARVERNRQQQQDWSGLEAWYQALIARSSAPAELYQKLALFYFQRSRFIDSLAALDTVASYQGLSEEDQSLHKANTDAMRQSSVAAISLQRQGEHYIAQIDINGRSPAAMLIDTGASISGLDSDYVRSQGLQASGRKISLNTASGRMETDLIRLSSIDIGSTRLFDLDVAALDLGGSYQGLLGMDVLTQFEFYLDQSEAILYLRSANSSESGAIPFSESGGQGL